MKVYILHGWSVSTQNEQKWEVFREHLSSAGIESDFLKIPGLSAPLTEVWRLEDFVAWLSQVLPDEPVALLGHSFGGQIAIRFSAQNPERVSKLILIDSAGIRDHAPWPTLKRNVFWVAAKIGKLFFRSALARQLVYRVARERDYYTAPPLLRRTMSHILDEEVTEDLARIRVETLIVWGAQDSVTPLKLGKQFSRALACSQLRVVSGARHSPQFTHPQQTAALVADFL